MAYDFDYFVIGGGSGGVRSARIAARNGARVAVAEDHDMGGTCVNRGCVPKKFMVFAGQFRRMFQDAADYGWKHSGKAPGFDWPSLRDKVAAETQRLSGLYQKGLDGVEATVFHAHAKITGPHEVEVDGKTVTAKHILIAVGGEPFMPEIPGIDHAISSDEIFHLKEFPKRLVVNGAGYIGLEFASIFNALGSEVTVVYRGSEVLRGFDHDLRHQLCTDLAEAGINFRFNENITELEEQKNGLKVHLTDGKSLEADQVLFAIGRRPRVEGLGLDTAGVMTDDKGAIIVNEGYQTSVPSIYAVGDVTNRANLTPVAIREGHWLADQLFGEGGNNRLDYAMVTPAVFTTPELGTVGLSEEDAITAAYELDIYRTKFRSMRYAFSDNKPYTMMKLVVDKASRRVLGAHMLGENAGEIIQTLAVAITMGATKEQVDATVALHPTVAEEFVTMREPAASTLSAKQAAE